jgi:hypothetical protein
MVDECRKKWIYQVVGRNVFREGPSIKDLFFNGAVEHFSEKVAAALVGLRSCPNCWFIPLRD